MDLIAIRIFSMRTTALNTSRDALIRTVSYLATLKTAQRKTWVPWKNA